MRQIKPQIFQQQNLSIKLIATERRMRHIIQRNKNDFNGKFMKIYRKKNKLFS